MIDNADQAFKLFDADGDGKINGEELKALVDKVGENDQSNYGDDPGGGQHDCWRGRRSHPQGLISGQ